MIRFQLGGRLGNQLFQWSSALDIKGQFNSVQLVFDDYHQNNPSPLLYEVTDGIFNIKKNNIVGRLLQIEDKWPCEIPGLNKIIYTSQNPHAQVTNIPNKSKVLRGYFQNWRNVSRNEEYIFKTLDRVVTNRVNFSIKLQEIRDQLGKFHAVHVRHGDFQDSSFGVLSPDYYANNRGHHLHPVVIFTDSYNLDEKYLKAIRPDFIYSPVELNAEDSLALMSMSQSLVMANSTFSWWAAFVVSQKGNEVLIPNHWQKNEKSHGALLHPKFKAVESIFN